MYQLMTTQSLALAQELDGQISAIAQRHATSQLAKNTLTNLSARPDELLFQAFAVFADVSFLRSGTIEARLLPSFNRFFPPHFLFFKRVDEVSLTCR